MRGALLFAMFDRRGQAAIEFLTTYGLALLIILAIIGILYFSSILNPGRYIQRQCMLESGLECSAFSLMKNDTNITFLLAGTNGLGRDIGFENGSFTLTVENLGGVGKKNYTGTCSPSIVKKGWGFMCIVTINDRQRIPQMGELRNMLVSFEYKDCESDTNYTQSHDCFATSVPTRTVQGTVNTQMEAYAAPLICGNGRCDDNFGETITNCPADCTPKPRRLSLTAQPSAIPANGSSVSTITATVWDQFGDRLSGVDVTFTKNTTQGTLSGTVNSTNASGIAVVYLTSGTVPTTVLVTASAETANDSTIVRFTSPS